MGSHFPGIGAQYKDAGISGTIAQVERGGQADYHFYAKSKQLIHNSCDGVFLL